VIKKEYVNNITYNKLELTFKSFDTVK